MIKFHPFDKFIKQQQNQKQNSSCRQKIFISLVDLKIEQMFLQNFQFINDNSIKNMKSDSITQKNQQSKNSHIAYQNIQNLLWVSQSIHIKIKLSQSLCSQQSQHNSNIQHKSIHFLYLPSLSQYITKSTQKQLKQLLVNQIQQITQKYQTIYTFIRIISSSIVYDFGSKYIRYDHYYMKNNNVMDKQKQSNKITTLEMFIKNNIMKNNSLIQQNIINIHKQHSNPLINFQNIPYFVLLKNNSSSCIYQHNNYSLNENKQQNKQQILYQMHKIKLTQSQQNKNNCVRMQIQSQKPGIYVKKKQIHENKGQQSNQILNNNTIKNIQIIQKLLQIQVINKQQNVYKCQQNQTMNIITYTPIKNKSCIKLVKFHQIAHFFQNPLSMIKREKLQKLSRLSNKQNLHQMFSQINFYNKFLNKLISNKHENNQKLIQIFNKLFKLSFSQQNFNKSKLTFTLDNLKYLEKLIFIQIQQIQKQLQKQLIKKLKQKIFNQIHQTKSKNLIVLMQNQFKQYLCKHKEIQYNEQLLQNLLNDQISLCKDNKNNFNNKQNNFLALQQQKIISKLYSNLSSQLLNNKLPYSQYLPLIFVTPFINHIYLSKLNNQSTSLLQNQSTITQLTIKIHQQSLKISQLQQSIQSYKSQQQFHKKILSQSNILHHTLSHLQTLTKTQYLQIQSSHAQIINLKDQLQQLIIKNNKINTQKSQYLQSIHQISKQMNQYIDKINEFKLQKDYLMKKYSCFDRLENQVINKNNQIKWYKNQVNIMKQHYKNIEENFNLFKNKEIEKVNLILKDNYKVFQKELEKNLLLVKNIEEINKQLEKQRAENFRLINEVKYVKDIYYQILYQNQENQEENQYDNILKLTQNDNIMNINMKNLIRQQYNSNSNKI